MFRISLVCCLAWLLAQQPVRAEEAARVEAEPALRDSRPEFPGGLAGFRRWVLRQLSFPAAEFDPGDLVMVQVSVRISRKGRISEAGLIRTSHDEVARQVMKFIGRSPAWTPAVRGGKAADAEMRLNFEMRLYDAAAGGEKPLLCAEDVSIYTRADTLPAFAAGDLVQWLRGRVLAADPSLDGELQRRTVRFIVEKDGSVSDVRIGGPKDDRLRSAIGEALGQMPVWSPAVVQGEAVRFRIRLEVPFSPEKLRSSVAQDEPYLLAERMPSFRSGNLDTFRSWIGREVKYPAEALRDGASGRVVVSFIVERDGSVSHIEVLRSPHDAFSDEVVRALRNSPAWTPGEQDGRTVRVKYSLPIDFHAPAPRPARPGPVDPAGRRSSQVRRF